MNDPDGATFAAVKYIRPAGNISPKPKQGTRSEKSTRLQRQLRHLYFTEKPRRSTTAATFFHSFRHLICALKTYTLFRPRS